MQRTLVLVFSVALATLVTGCASVTGSPHQSISLQTRDQHGEEVSGANCELLNNKGRWQVVTPGSVMINKSNQDMHITCSKDGMEPGKQTIVSETKGSMYGNIILGGGIGALIDHNSGAAYEYPGFVRVMLRALGKPEANSAATTPTTTAPQTVPAPAALATPAAPKLARMQVNTGKKPSTGDEWEYLAEDKVFGKRKKLVWRVKSIESEGIVEELIVDGIPSQQWLFSDKPAAISAPIEMGFVLGQHWDPQSTISQMDVKGPGECAERLKCRIEARIAGYERITIAAGTFDAIRVDGDLILTYLALRPRGQFTAWYSEKDRRLLKQVATFRSGDRMTDETLELQVARAYQ